MLVIVSRTLLIRQFLEESLEFVGVVVGGADFFGFDVALFVDDERGGNRGYL